MKFKIIACINKNLALGKDGNLLYHIKGDLANFKRMTTNNVIIMGRKTFESLPNSQPLPNRINVIVTNNIDYNVDSSFENVYIVHSVEDAIELCDMLFEDKTCFVVGGQTLYSAFLGRDLVDLMYLTEVNDDAEGDAFFPQIDESWCLFYQSYTQRQRSDEITYKFSIYIKK